MAVCATPWRRIGARWAFPGLLLVATVLGCDRFSPPAPPAENKPPPDGAPTDAAPAQPQAAIDPRLNQTFDQATRQDPPPSAPRPPDTTLTNKSVGKLYTDVVRLWKDIPFVTAEGRRVEYTATLETDLGA